MSEIEPFEFECEDDKIRLLHDDGESIWYEVADSAGRWFNRKWDFSPTPSACIRALLAERTRLQSRIAELERAFNIESNNFCDTAVDYLALKEEDTRRAGVFARLMESTKAMRDELASEGYQTVAFDDVMKRLQLEWDAAPGESERDVDGE